MSRFPFSQYSLQQFVATAIGLLLILNSTPKLHADDQEIATAVNSALDQDTRTTGAKIEVNCQKGIVTLSGHVPTLAARRYAIREAEKFSGVVGVVDNLTVDIEKRDDIEIVSDVTKRINNNASIQCKRLKVHCIDGHVTLSGEVEDYSEELEAGLVASEVRGVRKVNNHMMTKFTGSHSDEQVAAAAKAAIDRDVYLAGLPLEVSASKGEVTIDGKVGSAFEKSRVASKVSQLSHVKAVDNRLQIDPHINRGVRTKSAWKSEEELEDALRLELTSDARIDASKINVEVEYGHAVLTGSVETFNQRRLAEQDARDVVGVVWVTNSLSISGPLCDDALLKSLSESELNSDAMLHRFKIGVRCSSGKVTLSGKVDTAYEKAHAEHIIGHIRGVGSIDNAISLPIATPTDDGLVKTIENQLAQNTQTRESAKTIKVEVTNGVALLTGYVIHWAERYEAEQIAFKTKGIWKVENRLKVEGIAYPWEDWQREVPKQYDGTYFPSFYFNYEP